MKNNNTNFCYTLYKPDVHGVCKTVFLPSNLISGENIVFLVTHFFKFQSALLMHKSKGKGRGISKMGVL